MTIMTIRVVAKTENAFRTIYCDPDTGLLECDCVEPWEMCAHVDAAVVVGEDFMVHPDDRAKARFAHVAFKGKVYLPDDWKRSWIRNKRWRGIPFKPRSAPPPGSSPARPAFDPAKPTVSFTGRMSARRAALMVEAQAAGWNAITYHWKKTEVLVVGTEPGADKVNSARLRRIPIVSEEVWPTIRDA